MEPLVRFPTRDRSLRIAHGTILIDAVRDAGLPIARACGATGLCGRCGLAILAGGEALAPESADETRAKERNRIDPRLRLACRVQVEDDLSVSAPYW